MERGARRLLAVAGAAALAACSGPAPALVPVSPSLLPSSAPLRAATRFKFTTLDDPYYTSFNRLTGINNEHRIAGYYGRGGAGEPREGYHIYPPYRPRNYFKIEFPGATQTIATSLNNRKTLAGYYIARQGGARVTFGFVDSRGIWSSYQDPQARGKTSATLILGLNDAGTAVGAARAGPKTYAFKLDVGTGKFEAIVPPGAANAVAAGINGDGDVVGYMTKRGTTVGFLRKDGQYRDLTFPHARSTELLGITTYDRIVGSFIDRLGVTHGLLLTHPSFKTIAWQRIDDPNGTQTTVTGINLHGEIVGWFIDPRGNTHGFVATEHTASPSY